MGERYDIDDDDVQIIIDSLRSSKGDSPATRRERDLADALEGDLMMHRRSRLLRSKAEAKLAAARAERAKKATLTARQAQSLAAVRARKSPTYRWEPEGYAKGWRGTRTMGGAVYRMVGFLVEEGLLTDRPYSLTPEGLARLEEWEKKHGKIGEAG